MCYCCTRVWRRVVGGCVGSARGDPVNKNHTYFSIATILNRAPVSARVQIHNTHTHTHCIIYTPCLFCLCVYMCDKHLERCGENDVDEGTLID